MWLAHTGYGLPFAIYLLRNFMGGLPREVFESAAIDGASHVTSFFRLALPMSVPAIAALAIFQFLFVWNDLLVALIYLGAANPDNLPLTIAVANLVTSLGGGWEFLAAAAFLSMALPLVVFVDAAALLRPRHHGRLRQGLTRGGSDGGAPPPARSTPHGSARQAILEPVDLLGQLGIAGSGAVDDRGRCPATRTSLVRQPARRGREVAHRPRPARVRGARDRAPPAPRSPAPSALGPADDGLEARPDDRQAPWPGRRGQRLATCVQRQRARPGKPLDGRPKGLDGRARGRLGQDIEGQPGRRLEARLASGRCGRRARARSAGRPRTSAPASSRVRDARRPGQSATISSSGSSAAWGIAAQIASVTNGMNGWSRRR